jgi:hypothetical protein
MTTEQDKNTGAKPPQRARFAVASPGAQERGARSAAVKAIHVADGLFKRAEQVFNRLVAACEENGEPFAMVIPAPSGVGKTSILEHLARDRRLASFTDEHGLTVPLVCISAPSPCTLKTLGIELHAQLTGSTLSSRMNSQEIWTRLRTNLYNLNVSILMIDEMHHLFETNDSGGVRQVVASTLKSLLIGRWNDPDGVAEAIGALPPSVKPRPIGLVLSGMPSVRDAIALDHQLERRSRVVAIHPMTRSAKDMEMFKIFVQLVQKRLDFTPLPDLTNDDMLLRLHAASGGYLGRAAFLIKQAAYLAIDMSYPTLDRVKHFARVFEEIYQVGDLRNPFLIPDIGKLDLKKVLDPSPRQTLLRGKMNPSADGAATRATQ